MLEEFSELEKRTILTGTREERIIQIMKKAGWYEGRCVDISIPEKYYHEMGIKLNESTIKFYKEFYGIASDWYFNITDIYRYAPDFEFALSPTIRSSIFPYNKEDDYTYKRVKEYSKEDIDIIGYLGDTGDTPELCIGESGRIYTCAMGIYAYGTIFELLDNALYQRKFPLNSVAMKRYVEYPEAIEKYNKRLKRIMEE